MTQQVPTSGFNVPGQGGVEVPPPPSSQNPGFVPNPAGSTPPAATTAAEPAAGTPPAQSAPDLNNSIAALLAALQAQQGAAPAADAPAAAEVQPAADGRLNSIDPATIEDPILRSMATVMQTVGKGLDMDRVFSKALEHGDASLLDLAYLREKGGQNAEQLVTIAQGIVQAVEAQATAITNEVHNLAGGSSVWESSVAAFNKGAPVELRQVVALMLDSKSKSQITAGAKLVVEFAKGSGMIPQNKGTVATGGAAVPQAMALSKEAFQAELRKLDPYSQGYEGQRAELFARRQQGRQLGM